MKKKLISVLTPSFFKRQINNIYLSYQYQRYISTIRKFKDIHKGERCFIIGTGPSLNKTNFKLLKNEILFGVNTFYRGLSKFKINCQYYACSDEVVYKNHFKNILNLDTTLFLSSEAGKFYLLNKIFFQQYQRKKPILLNEKGSMVELNKFPKDISKGVYWGSTVIIDVCLPVAYYMGFKKVYLLGCDCDYSKLHRFDGLKSDRFLTPAIEGDFSLIFKSYEVCKKAFEQEGREIINATVGGKLEIFKRKTLEKIIYKK